MKLNKHNSWKFSIFFLLVWSFVCSSCDEKPMPFGFSEDSQPAIYGVATPVKMDMDTTTIYLADYFSHPEQVDSMQFPAGLEVERLNDQITVSGHLSAPYQVATFWVNQVAYQLVLQKSKKQNYLFQVVDANKVFSQVFIGGSMNGWVGNKDSLTYNEAVGKWEISMVLNPGEYQYHLWIDGKEQTDPTHERIQSNGMGGLNSVFTVGELENALPWVSAVGQNQKELLVKSDAQILAFWNNRQIPESAMFTDSMGIHIPIPSNAQNVERSIMRVFCYNNNQIGQDLWVPLDYGKVVVDASKLLRTDKQTYRMYFMMVDRFMDGNPANNQPVNDTEIHEKANFFGGDMEGVDQKITSNYFSELGVNTIWLSPIGQNPEGAWGLWTKGGPRTKFSGYHGYWPAESKKVDARFGSEDALKKLISDAHQKNMNVLLDYVANHIHITHPVYKAHPDWVTELYLPDGRKNTELWDEQRLTTWFDDFLPTLDLENPEVAEAMSDSALYWFQNYDIDGFRHDATKHIPTSFWRLLTAKLKHQVAMPQNRTIYQIGETYGNPELIGSYLNSGMLDGQFDFNLYDQAVQAFAKQETDFTPLVNTLMDGIANYGAHHLMGNISGNQDRCRFISYADGSVDFEADAKRVGWTQEITNQGTIGYQRLAMLHGFNFAIPGIPVIYYGDEIGLPGANDPDNRRWMQFDDLNEAQQKLKSTVSTVANFRASSMPMLYGQTRVIFASTSLLIIERSYLNEVVYAVFNKSNEKQTIVWDLPEAYQNMPFSSLFNSDLIQNKGLEITLLANSFDYIKAVK